jgi:hypothetical protein
MLQFELGGFDGGYRGGVDCRLIISHDTIERIFEPRRSSVVVAAD